MKHYDRQNPKPEFVIGLAGPVGTDMRLVSQILAQELRAYRYHPLHIRVSDLIQSWCSDEVQGVISDAKEDLRIDRLMNAGDLIRSAAGTGAGVMPLVVSAIRHARQKTLLAEGCEIDFEDVELYNHCFIINSLKHPDEVEVLRRIYGEKFVMVSAVLSQSKRKEYLQSKIAKSYNRTDYSSFSQKAEFLIEKDRRRSGSSLGQNISGTFHLADYFLRANECIEKDAKRLLHMLFGHPGVTPTRNEFVMFEARSNALRSGDLSRQVGAVVTNSNLEIVSRGCNEVPTVGGDTYWADDEGVLDTRDYAAGRDFNAVKKVEILEELFEFLDSNSFLKVESSNDGPGHSKSSQRLVSQLVFGDKKGAFKDLRVSNLIEFGRMVHAEMFALMEAARRGLAVEGGTLYCTTFPCHMCARHIIAAGIREVFYIEPYPKSMTQELYGDMVSIEPNPDEVEQSRNISRPAKVYFQPFHGAAPRIFQAAFEMPKRKDEQGYRLPYDEEKARPKWISLSKSHIPLEAMFASVLRSVPIVADVTAITGKNVQ
ncbi:MULTISPECIES: anti-phage dCTP deaminase [unclassified Sphingopyxis]|uniref:anti-phage dCTP deaminase n=1 Tax=unclassified Sphingopyxis TaxID=2614943 RepID=UPI0009EB91EF|nr:MULTISPECIES: anti-phage dCTP deaminase [unclassified Sphingopyxis]